MKKCTLLLIVLFFAVATQAQTVRTESDITCLGQFCLGSPLEELMGPLINHMTDKSDIEDSVEENGSMMLTNVTFDEFMFDVCLLNFNKDGLCNIQFEKYFKEGDDSTVADMLVELRSIFAEKYGEQPESPEFDENDTMKYVWFDEDGSVLSILMILGKEEGKIVMSASQKEDPVIN